MLCTGIAWHKEGVRGRGGGWQASSDCTDSSLLPHQILLTTQKRREREPATLTRSSDDFTRPCEDDLIG